MIERQHKIIERYEEDLDPGKAEVIEFEMPQGKFKVCYNRRPKVIDKKTHYSHRGGGDVKVDYVFDPEQESTFLTLLRWSDADNDWHEIKGDALF